MRLIESDGTGGFRLTKDLLGDDEIPPYGILSHTWQNGEEVTFNDIEGGTGNGKSGYKKIEFCMRQAKRDDLHYIWVDTCCINKSDNVELQHALNSMFRWYENAVKCYVFLSDVSTNQGVDNESDEIPWGPAFRGSRWFTRCWTLQELLAPMTVEFYSKEGNLLGTRQSLEIAIHEITGIQVEALQRIPLRHFDVDDRFSWAENRRATREEDKAYALLGIFGIFMVPNYGEGEQNAVARLRRKI
ncbi:HET-domain-containing protein, partial [Lophiostoma macrostomum CBS 122681]